MKKKWLWKLDSDQGLNIGLKIQIGSAGWFRKPADRIVERPLISNTWTVSRIYPNLVNIN